MEPGCDCVSDLKDPVSQGLGSRVFLYLNRDRNHAAVMDCRCKCQQARMIVNHSMGVRYKQGLIERFSMCT